AIPQCPCRLHCAAAARARHSSPPRRSSDLLRGGLLVAQLTRLAHLRGVLHADRHDLVQRRDRVARTDLAGILAVVVEVFRGEQPDRKSTRLNSSHVKISYAVFCLKKKKPPR